MKYKIKNLEHIKQDNALADILSNDGVSKSFVDRLLKGFSNRNKITTDTLFDFVDMYRIDDSSLKFNYCLLENKLGIFIIREDNIEVVDELEDVCYSLGIKRVINVGNKTILVSDSDYTMGENNKVIIERKEPDENDPVKALMICLLKRDGYNIDDIYAVAEAFSQNNLKEEYIIDTSDNNVIADTIEKEVKKSSKKKEKKSK
ncbi:hypothetical protein [uncultured Clostridium sp.]|uniref:hypothetical protein n=1 Tax=uncultured Clostridium sp. TaxID=59620 RepID=UPI00261DA7D9|nr:hypothetical protein [uncultured Clostridium sp.]